MSVVTFGCVGVDDDAVEMAIIMRQQEKAVFVIIPTVPSTNQNAYGRVVRGKNCTRRSAIPATMGLLLYNYRLLFSYTLCCRQTVTYTIYYKSTANSARVYIYALESIHV